MRYCSLDLETFIFSPSCSVPQPVSLALGWKGDIGLAPGRDCLDMHTALYHFNFTDVKPLLHWLFEQDITIVGANIPYDMLCLIRYGYVSMDCVWDKYKRGQVLDVQTRDKLLLTAQGRIQFDYVLKTVPRFSLASCVMRHMGIDISASKNDGVRMGYGNLWNLPISSWPMEYRDYAEQDAAYTIATYLLQGYDSPDQWMQHLAQWSLWLLREWGMCADADKVAALSAHIESEFWEGATIAVDSGMARQADKGVVKNIKNIRDEITRVAEQHELEYTKSGNISYKREFLERFTDRSAPLAAVVKIMAVEKIRGTYIDILRSGTEYPIRAWYNVLVATGRTSCSGPPMQQLPREGGVRECLVPRPNKVFVACDYSFQELVCLAQQNIWKFEYSDLATVINNGQDPHLFLAAKMLNIEYAEASIRIQNGDREVKQYRQLAKVPNFGYPGGMGPGSLVDFAWKSYGIRITQARAGWLRAMWFATYTDMRKHLGWVQASLDASPTEIYSAGGRKKVFDITLPSGRVRGRVGYCDGANTVFQAFAADCTKEALISVTHACYCEEGHPLFGARPVAYLHDEIILEADERYASVAAHSLHDIMVERMQELCPDVRVSAEATIMRYWSKEAFSIIDDANVYSIWPDRR